jgi:hypothetical protein
MKCQASVPRDAFPPTPPGPEGSNGNGLLRVQWGAGAWLSLSGPRFNTSLKFSWRPAILPLVGHEITLLA